MILTKLVFIVYIGISYVNSPNTNIPWLVFSLLTYICVGMAYYFIKNEKIKMMVVLLTITILLIFYHEIQPLFILLLPISLCELTSSMKSHTWIFMIIGCIPILLIANDLVPIYVFAAAMSFFMFKMAVLYTKRVTENEIQLDKMRKDLDRLTKSLNENNEYMKQSEYTFKLEERNRLSQEIHDKIGHSMTGALIQMEASKRMMEIDKNKSMDLLQNAIHILKDGIENIRITLKNIKPATEQMGLNRVKLLIDEFAVKHHIKTPLIYKGNMEMITPIQWKIIHENITEALTNALKYSNATIITIEIQVLNKLIKVEVKDNGKGAMKINKGLGIVGMEERTASVNGKIIVDGSNGFSVTTLLPIA